MQISINILILIYDTRLLKKSQLSLREAETFCRRDPGIVSDIKAIRRDIKDVNEKVDKCIPRPKESSSSSTHTTASNSKRTREEGNTFFKQAQGEDDITRKRSGLEKALQRYQDALSSATNDDEVASAAKNAAMMSFHLAHLCQKTDDADKNNLIQKYFKDALEFFSKAHKKRAYKGPEWTEYLVQHMQKCYEDIRTWLNKKEVSDRIPILVDYLSVLSDRTLKAKGHIHLANLYLKKCQDDFEAASYNACKRSLEKCERSVSTAENNGRKDPGIVSNIQVLRKEIKHQSELVDKCIAKAEEERLRLQKEKNRAKEKENAWKEIAEDIEELERIARLPAAEFVENLYKNWPPNCPTQPDASQPKDFTAKSTKKMLLRAISHYHPDKVDTSMGVEWCLLCDEITKNLNRKLAKC